MVWYFVLVQEKELSIWTPHVPNNLNLGSLVLVGKRAELLADRINWDLHFLEIIQSQI